MRLIQDKGQNYFKQNVPKMAHHGCRRDKIKLNSVPGVFDKNVFFFFNS